MLRFQTDALLLRDPRKHPPCAIKSDWFGTTDMEAVDVHAWAQRTFSTLPYAVFD